MTKPRILILAALAALMFAAPASAASFSELFPELPNGKIYSNQDISDLAQTMLDPNADSENNCDDNTPPGNGCTGSGYTYFGQFVDHDITLDRAPSPTTPVDPRTLTNFRTFSLDLDSVYGGGPTGSPQFYTGNKFKLQEPNPNGVRDFPRNPDGTAIINESRNDENQIVGQEQIAFMKAHNRLIDEGSSFAQARAILTAHYQDIVLHDFLEGHVFGTSLNNKPFNDPEVKKLAAKQKDGSTPIEFSTAAYRFGHSQVRRAYFLNDLLNVKVQVLSITPGVDQLVGGRNILARHQADWTYFFPEFEEDAEDHLNANHGRKIDGLISSSLFALPNPFVANASNVLGFLNMRRAQFYGAASGESVAKALGRPVLTSAQLGLTPTLAAKFAGDTPLWFYILKESQVVEGGRRLGPVGSRIVAASFLAMSGNTNANFKGDPRIVGPDGKLTLSDIFTFARVQPFDGEQAPE